MRPQRWYAVSVALLVLVVLLALGLFLRWQDVEEGTPAGFRAVGGRVPEQSVSLPQPADDARVSAGVVRGQSAGVPDADRATVREPLHDAAVDVPQAGRRADCGLALRVVDSPGGLAVTEFEFASSAWSPTDPHFGAWEHVEDSEGRARLSGLTCEQQVGIVCRAPGRPRQLFGPFLPAQDAEEIELILGGPAGLLITVVDVHDLPQLAGSKWVLARQVCSACREFEEVHLAPPVRVDQDLIAATIRIEGLAAGRYTVTAANGKWGTDLVDFELIPGETTSERMVLRTDHPQGTLSVRVTRGNVPIPGMRVELGAGMSRPADFSMDPLFALTDIDGRCQFEALSPDLYPVWLAPHEHRSVASIRPGAETNLELQLDS